MRYFRLTFLGLFIFYFWLSSIYFSNYSNLFCTIMRANRFNRFNIHITISVLIVFSFTTYGDINN